MRPADAATRPLAPTAATTPTAALDAASNASAGFGQLFDTLRAEVADYIAHGDGADGGAVAASRPTVEGALLHARASDGVQGNAQQQAFLDSIAPWARQAAERLGVAPELVQAHAALESGWGQRPLRVGGGADSHNVFGIKAGAGWAGAGLDAATTEFVDGAPVPTRERFRAYPDAAGAFADYTRLLLDNPRYRGALHTGSDAQAFAAGLVRGGYATDPAYAAKLARIAASLQRNVE